jgi:Plant transposon protein
MRGGTFREQLIATQQEAVRNAMERVFAVLFSRFNYSCRPFRLLDKVGMKYIMLACCILRNMICELRKES